MKKLTLLLTSMLISVCLASTTLAEDAPAQKLTVILDWATNPNHAPLIIAQQNGFFKERGLEVEFIKPADPNEPSKLIAAGKADIGIAYEPNLMQQIDRDLPLIRIGTLIDKPLDCLVALKSSQIKTLADLKNKRIGTSGNGLNSIMLKMMLEKQGLTDKDIKLVDINYNLTQALLTHKVDAITNVMRNFEVPMLDLANHKIETFFPEEHGVPNYSALIFISNTAAVNDPRLPLFLAAVKKAVAYLDDHPKQAWQQFIKQYPELNTEVNHEAWFTTLPYFAEDPANFHANEWQQFAEFMQQNALIKTVQPMSRYAVVLR